MNDEERPNLELALNPCCGYLTDSAEEIPEFIRSTPNVGDLAVCLNCGTILCYTETGISNKTRLARRQDIELAPRRERRYLARIQKYVRKRGRFNPPPFNQ